MNSSPVAAIDLGSNTVRLLVGSCESGRIHRLLQCQDATRLSQGLKSGEKFLPEAANRTWDVLKRYQLDIAKLGVCRVLCCGTMALREAADGPDFVERIRRELRFEALVLSGVQEARLTSAGVFTGIDPVPEASVVFDLGGRSTEFVLARQDRSLEAVSLEMGVVGLTELYLEYDPPSDEQVTACRARVRHTLHRALAEWRVSGRGADPTVLIGTAGTTTTLAAMAQEMTVYDRELIDNYRLDRLVLERMFVTMLSLKRAERAEMPGLPPERADIIVAGAAVVLEIMDYIGANHLVVSDAGLLEGIWLAAAGLRSIEHGC